MFRTTDMHVVIYIKQIMKKGFASYNQFENFLTTISINQLGGVSLAFYGIFNGLRLITAKKTILYRWKFVSLLPIKNMVSVNVFSFLE